MRCNAQQVVFWSLLDDSYLIRRSVQSLLTLPAEQKTIGLHDGEAYYCAVLVEMKRAAQWATGFTERGRAARSSPG